MASNIVFPTPAGSAAPIAPTTATPVGQTVLVIGIIPGLPASSYYTPFSITSIKSAANLFGIGDMTRAIGEVQRQGAPAIIAIAIAGENELSGLFDYLTDIPFDIVVPARQIATADLLLQFGNFAYLRENQGQPIVVVMPGLVDTVSNLEVNPAGALIGTSVFDPTVVLGRYFVLTLDQLVVNPDYPAQYTADAAPSLAGLMARNLPSTSITNKTLLGVALVAGYDPADCLTLSSVGYTVLRQSIRHGLVPYLGVTATATAVGAINYSESYHKVQTLRTCQYVVSSINAAMSGIIGESTVAQVQTRVTTTLNNLQSEGAIVAYDSSVNIIQSAGSIYISLNILPSSELTMIAVSTNIAIPGAA